VRSFTAIVVALVKLCSVSLRSWYNCADLVTIEKSGDRFRLLYDTKGRFVLHSVPESEAGFKLARVTGDGTSAKNIPYITTHVSSVPIRRTEVMRFAFSCSASAVSVAYLSSACVLSALLLQDGRTIRYPDPLISKGDTVKIDLATGKVTDFVKFEVGNTVMVTGGRNTGRIGTLIKVDRHPGSFDIVAVKDAEGTTFATRRTNVFTIGKGGDAKNALVSLPKGKGIKKTIFDERAKRLGSKA